MFWENMRLKVSYERGCVFGYYYTDEQFFFGKLEVDGSFHMDNLIPVEVSSFKRYHDEDLVDTFMEFVEDVHNDVY